MRTDGLLTAVHSTATLEIDLSGDVGWLLTGSLGQLSGERTKLQQVSTAQPATCQPDQKAKGKLTTRLTSQSLRNVVGTEPFDSDTQSAGLPMY